jgi:hypothetical protein
MYHFFKEILFEKCLFCAAGICVSTILFLQKPFESLTHPPLWSAEHCRICQCKRWAMFELSRLIARESEFRPSPDKSEARREVFCSFTAKNRGTGVAFFWLLFLAKQEK